MTKMWINRLDRVQAYQEPLQDPRKRVLHPRVTMEQKVSQVYRVPPVKMH